MSEKTKYQHLVERLENNIIVVYVLLFFAVLSAILVVVNQSLNIWKNLNKTTIQSDTTAIYNEVKTVNEIEFEPTNNKTIIIQPKKELEDTTAKIKRVQINLGEIFPDTIKAMLKNKVQSDLKCELDFKHLIEIVPDTHFYRLNE